MMAMSDYVKSNHPAAGQVMVNALPDVVAGISAGVLSPRNSRSTDWSCSTRPR